jgi:hypothetical protein
MAQAWASAALRTVPAPATASGTSRAMRFDAGQRLRRAQRDLQHADAAGHQRTRQQHGLPDVAQHDDGNHRRILHHLQGGQLAADIHVHIHEKLLLQPSSRGGACR